MTKIPVPNRQLRRHEFVLHFGHIFKGERYDLYSVEEKNNLFANWWSQWIKSEFPTTVRYLAASLEHTPDADRVTGHPNKNAGILHVNAAVFWTKPVRVSQNYHSALYLPSHDDESICGSWRMIGSPAAMIDYVTAAGKYASKPYVDLFQWGDPPFQSARRKEALTDLLIQFVKEGYTVKEMWSKNPRVVVHFGLLKIRDLVELEQEIARDQLPNRGDKPSVTGFSNGL